MCIRDSTNDALDYFKSKESPDTSSPYLGIGKRHGDQQWSAVLSAHVWVMGCLLYTSRCV